MKKTQESSAQTAELPPSPTTKAVRFTLNPHSSRDRRILAWLARIPLYHRAEALRSVLDDYLLGREETTGSETLFQVEQRKGEPPSADHSLASADSKAEQKLKTLFS